MHRSHSECAGATEGGVVEVRAITGPSHVKKGLASLCAAWTLLATTVASGLKQRRLFLRRQLAPRAMQTTRTSVCARWNQLAHLSLSPDGLRRPS